MNLRTRQIWQLALPSVISNITVPLLGLVDITIVGHIGDARYIGAIAVGTMLFNVVSWVFGFLRMGTGGLTSQAYGQRHLGEVVRLFRRSVLMATALGLLFIVLQWPLIRLGLWAMRPDDAVLALSRQYCHIVIWGAPAVLGQYAVTGWLVGMQNTRVPMVTSMGQNVVNIIVSLLLVFVFKLDMAGVAFGTLVAQWSGFLLSILLVNRWYGRLWHYCHNSSDAEFTGEWPALKTFFRVNRDIFLRTLFLVSVFLFFTAAGSRQGALVLAVNTLLMQFFTIFSYFTDGFAYAGEALSGKYYGAGNMSAFREVVARLFYMGSWLAVGFTVLYLLGGRFFLQLLTSDATVVEASPAYFWWAAMLPMVGITAFLLDGIFVGITHTRGLLLSSVIAALVFFAIFLLGHHAWGNHALWLAFVTYLAVRGGVELVLYRRLLHTRLH